VRKRVGKPSAEEKPRPRASDGALGQTNSYGLVLVPVPVLGAMPEHDVPGMGARAEPGVPGEALVWDRGFKSGVRVTVVSASVQNQAARPHDSRSTNHIARL
jgi:hypothetical protein